MKSISYHIALFCAALGLTGCGFWPDASYRYRLTLAIQTPEGVRTASNVVEIDYFRSWTGVPHRTYGQAIVVDLGPSGVLSVLLSQKLLLDPRQRSVWIDADPSWMILQKCVGDQAGAADLLDVARQIKQCKGVYPLKLSELPDMIVFRDAKEPSSAVVIRPSDFAASLAPDASIQMATIQVTDDPITYEVDRLLPWVRHWTGRIAKPAKYRIGPIENYFGFDEFIQEGRG